MTISRLLAEDEDNMKLIMENWRKFVLKESLETIESGQGDGTGKVWNAKVGDSVLVGTELGLEPAVIQGIADGAVEVRWSEGADDAGQLAQVDPRHIYQSDRDNDGLRDDKEQAIADILDDEGYIVTPEEQAEIEKGFGEEDQEHVRRSRDHKDRWK